MAITGTIYGTTSNQYIDAKIEYSYTQQVAMNASTITATLYYKRNNTGYVTSGKGHFLISIDGKITGTSKTISIGDAWVEAMTQTTSVTHNNDGSRDVLISCSQGILSGTTLTYTNCSDTIRLQTIPRISTLESIPDTKISEELKIRWTPMSKYFRFKLKFSLGNWSYETGVIHPDRISQYTFSGHSLPYSVAEEIPADKTKGTMTVTLYTYSDSSATQEVGTNTRTFGVIIPEDSVTKPTITTMRPSYVNYNLNANLTPLYIQGKSRVLVVLSGEAKYGATVSRYGMTVLGKGYEYPFQSEPLNTSGDVEILGRIWDSRGFYNERKETISVLPYSKPKLVRAEGEASIICTRCDSSGKISASGTSLKIKVARSYSKLVSGGEQKNFCKVQYRYKNSGASDFGDWKTLLNTTDTSDSVEKIISDVAFSATTSYEVEVRAIDDVGDYDAISYYIPTSAVTVHLGEDVDGVSVGKYAEHDKAFEVAPEWEMYYKGKPVPNIFPSLRGNKLITANSDLNNYKEPAVYAIATDDDASTVSNMPTFRDQKRAGILRVYASVGQEDVSSGTYKYITQEYRSVIADMPTFRRKLESDSSGKWTYGNWIMDKGSDTGWIQLVSPSGSLYNPRQNRRGDAGVFYRVINENHVYVRFNLQFSYTYGVIQLITGNTLIPSQYCPKYDATAMCRAGDIRKDANNTEYEVGVMVGVHVSSDGRIGIGYLYPQKEGLTSSWLGWVDGYIDYWL